MSPQPIPSGAATTARPRRAAAPPQGSREALQLAAAVLEVLSGLRTPAEAAQTLGVSLGRYYQAEALALRGLVTGCERRPRGRAASPGRALEALRRDNARLTREVQRQQALVRLARQAANLAAPAKPAAGPAAVKRRKRKVPRGQRTAARLRQAAEPTGDAPPPDGPGGQTLPG